MKYIPSLQHLVSNTKITTLERSVRSQRYFLFVPPFGSYKSIWSSPIARYKKHFNTTSTIQ
ncbi:hypothetical protein [Rufibacter soli]